MTDVEADERKSAIRNLETLANGIGSDIRALRKSRGMRLTQLAEIIGRSQGFVSQVERGRSEPSISDLRKIAQHFDVPISFFFGKPVGDPEAARHVVRANERRQLGNTDAGLVEELLSPDLEGPFEIVRTEIVPGAALSATITRETYEVGYIVSGDLEIEIAGRRHDLNAGDSFRLTGEPYRWRNSSDKPVLIVWVISPPIY